MTLPSGRVLRSLSRRGGWSVAGQAANSFGNLALAVVVARGADAAAFGAWSLGFAAYVLVVAAVRQVIATPLLLRLGGRPGDAVPPTETSGCVSASVLTGGVVAGLLALLAFVLPRPLATTALVFAALLPGLVLQDVLRYVSFAHRQPRRAAMSDLGWLVLQAAGFGVVIAMDLRGPVWPSVVWGASALVAAVPLAVAWRPRFRPSLARAYLRSHAQELPPLAADYGVVTVSSQLLPFAVAVAAGLAATAGLRAGLVLLGVVNVLVQGVTPLATVEAARLAAAGRAFAQRFVTVWSVSAAVLVTGYGTALLALPDRLGSSLFGASWVHASPVLLPLVVAAALNGPMIATQIALRARGQLRTALRLRASTALALLGLPLAGAATDGAVGAAWGLALGTALGAGLAIRTTRRLDPPGTPLATGTSSQRDLAPAGL